ncbi:MAG: hypothetical protein RR646_05920 [Erysipelotrichaceae bacterium]
MKMCIIGFNDEYVMPYYTEYKHKLQKKNIEFDSILFDRTGKKKDAENVYYFSKKVTNSKLNKAIAFIKWRKYVLNLLRKRKYDKLIVLTSIPAFLIGNYLQKNYKNNYIFDIRDFTHEGNMAYRKEINKIVNDSYFTSISSQGFLQWLEPSEKIILNHNCDEFLLKGVKYEKVTIPDKVKIGYFGIVDYERENVALIKALPKEDFSFLYQGIHDTCTYLKSHVSNNSKYNVVFKGKYDSQEKFEMYKDINIVNAVYGTSSLKTTTLVPNKFYDCLIYGKPILVSKGTYLSTLVEKYNLGISIEHTSQTILNEVSTYCSTFDSLAFNKGRTKAVQKIKNDIDIFERKLSGYIEK